MWERESITRVLQGEEREPVLSQRQEEDVSVWTIGWYLHDYYKQTFIYSGRAGNTHPLLPRKALCHTHTHMHTRTHTHTSFDTHSCTNSRTYARSHTHTQIQAHTLLYTHSRCVSPPLQTRMSVRMGWMTVRAEGCAVRTSSGPTCVSVTLVTHGPLTERAA